jgi:hypothetical protein
MKAYIRKQVQLKLETRRKEWEERQGQLISQQQQQQQLPVAPPSVNPTTVRLFNFTNNIHWSDEEEKDEIISNIKEFLNSIYYNHQQIVLSNSSSSSSPSGLTITSFLSNLSVWKVKNSFFSSTGLDQKINELLFPSSSSSSSSLTSSDSIISDDWIFSFVDIRFRYKELADLYVQFMNGMVISGETLKVIYSLEDSGETLTNFMQRKLEELMELEERQQGEQEKEKEQQTQGQIELNQLESDSPRLSSPANTFAVLLENIITEEEEVSDPDDVKETLSDIYSLSPEKQLPDLLWIEKRPLSTSFSLLYSTSSVFPATAILLTLRSLKESFRIYQLFHDKKINDYAFQVYYRNLFLLSNEVTGGSSLSSTIDLNNNHGQQQGNRYFVLGIKNFISFEEYQDEDERQEIAENILSLLNSFPNKNSNDTFQFETIFFVKEGEENDEEGNESEALVSIYFIFSSITFPLLIELFDHLKNQIISGNSLSLDILVIPSEDILQELLRVLSTDEERPFLLSSSQSLSRCCQLLLSSSVQEEEEEIQGESTVTMIIQSDFFRLDHWFSEEEEEPEQEKSDYNHTLEVKIKEEFLSLVNDCLGEGNDLKSLKSLSFPSTITTKEEEEEQRKNLQKEYLISLQYSSYSIAVSSLLYFDGLILGGKRVRAFLEEKGTNNKETKEDEKGMKRSSNILQYHDNHPQTKNQIKETALSTAVIPSTLKTKELPQFEFSFSSSNWQQYFDCAYFEFFFPSQMDTTPLSLLFLPQSSAKLSKIRETEESVDSNNDNPKSWEIQPEDLLKEEQSFLTAKNQEEKLFDENGNPIPPAVKPVGQQSIYPKVKALPKAGFHQVPSHSNIPVIISFLFIE